MSDNPIVTKPLKSPNDIYMEKGEDGKEAIDDPGTMKA